jgi:hypothetical protein
MTPLCGRGYRLGGRRPLSTVSPPLPTVTPADERRAGEGATGGIPFWVLSFLPFRLRSTCHTDHGSDLPVWGCG